MSDNCLFCKILNNEIPSERVFENEKVVAFKDIAPVAENHYLFIHREHTQDVFEMAKTDISQVQDIFAAIHEFAAKEGFDEKGFRIVTNNGEKAGQTVFHTHFHFISGERLGKFG